MNKEEVKQEGEFKIKKKPGRPKTLNKKDGVTKIDLSKKEEPKEDEKPKEEVVLNKQVEEEKVEEKPVDKTIEEKIDEKPLMEEVVKEEVKKEIKEPVEKAEPEIKLPENVEKLVGFMNDTGGTLEDYVRLNADYKNINEEALLNEYYKKTKPHLNQEEINFILEDNFYFDDEADDERTIKKKQVARKEEIAKARNFLEETKSKYYDEIKLRPGATQEQQKAMDFFNRYNEEQQRTKTISDKFQKRTSDLFNNDEFKGFKFDVGEKSFRYGINNEKVGQDQSNLDNFLRRFLDKDGQISDVQAYHKALYTATNADTIAKHFYEQGVADGTKDLISKSKNIDDTPRPSASGDIFINGLKVKAITGGDSSKLKIKRKITNK
jgi:hypothetical protein|tara:strand:+ start:1271 stop:2407 length:1137 start_codon:yes stop_codon:yes gene_type:complete